MLKDLEPKQIWKYFETYCSIPHPSKHEERASKFIQETAIRLGLSYKVDEVGNVLVFKKAFPGLEHHQTIVLQSHLDMVPQKNSDCEHDFLNDPISPYADNGWVKANGTTLGADNGIGVAIMLAVLESTDIKHGPIEALFTIDEETGMTGANKLSKDFFTGKKFINLDTEDEEELCIGCAGGINADATLMTLQEKVSPDKKAYNVALRGLRGGHSGCDIHLGRANAIKLMNRLIFTAIEKFDIRVCEFHGGNVRNAIPREAFATVVVPSAYAKDFELFIPEFQKIVLNEYSDVDPDIRFTFSETALPDKVLTEPSQDNLVRAIYACPNGAIRMSSSFEGVVQTSNNISILQCVNGKNEIHCLLRSSVDSEREDLGNAVLSSLALAEAYVEFSGGYPGWQPNPSSELLNQLQEIYEELFHKKPQIKVIHAGLECGIIGAKIPGIDMISCGPTIKYPHSPDEKVSIESVQRFWNFLRTVLERV
ncbi:MAG: aminoacyl-histidine dipeptidase [Fibrobacter sp.]|nr:aminoacyl-histidine dipeptidase [Fibrobacter sp.]